MSTRPKGELVCSPDDPDLDCNPDLDDINQTDFVEDYGNDFTVCKVNSTLKKCLLLREKRGCPMIISLFYR